MGGEKSVSVPTAAAVVGSPPRGRGKVFVCFLVTRSFGITPAWAGKSYNSAEALANRKDHPRVGGEKPAKRGRDFPARGSPPRGRGKEERRKPGEIRARITPAWAGKRRRRHGVKIFDKDHPRVGGEKSARYFVQCLLQGSPPRGRGKDIIPLLPPGKFGITPAWAGKRSGRAAAWPFCRDHPRVGGEKSRTRLVSAGDEGSPPRGRGKACSFQRSDCAVGITPAWAGKSIAKCGAVEEVRDHPRVGGEKGLWR